MRSIFLAVCLILLNAGSNAQPPNDTSSVYFPVAVYELDAASRGMLDSLVQAMNGQDAAQVQLYGYCDPRGSQAYNQDLSDKRTRSVYNYLLHAGMTADRITHRMGYGEDRPVNANSNEKEMQENRRVDIIWMPELKGNPVAQKNTEDTIRYFTGKTLDSVTEGETLRLKNINFYGGRHIFLPQSMAALNELVQVMKDHPTLVIEIQGHICCLWGDRDGMDSDTNEFALSRNRARAVYEYLAAAGIDHNRMTYVGLAGRVPFVYPERSEEDKTLNRRVEIKIIKK